jgi:hypothetical protein
MNRGVIRSTLRRQIRDTQSVEWDDDNEVNELINVAYAYVQKEIAKSFPEAHLFWTLMNLTAGTSWYPMPSTFGISQIGMKGASSDTFFNTLKGPKRYRDIGPRTVFSGGTQIAQPADLNSTYWTIRGQWFGIFPTPTTSITDGIEIIHTPIMTLSDDNEIPRIKTPLHMAILWWAKLLLLGDTDENVAETRARLNEVLSDIPLWYDNSRAEPDQLQVG